MRSCTRWRTLHSDQRGLESIEYLLIGALVIIAAIAAWRYFGRTIQEGTKDVALTIESTVQDSISTGRSDSPTSTGPVTGPPPPPPVPPNPMGPGVRHHIGDGNYGAGQGGGNLTNEGTTYNTRFNVTQAMIDYAREHGGKLYIKYEGYGVQPQGYTANTITLNGRQIGAVVNGTNTIAVDVSAFAQGSNLLTVKAGTTPNGPNRVDYDDFEFNNLSVGYTP
jgi:hypothetical protein